GATMLQPVGGMGRIGEAFGRKLGKVISYDAEVIELRRAGTGARIVWRHRKTGVGSALDAAHVICTIPPPVLKSLDADFAPEVTRALAAVAYIPAAKVAFRAERRFWELDQQLYGGISWTSRDITQIWYPSTGFHHKKGILVGAYIWTDAIGEAFAAKPLSQRLVDALADGERVHPGYGAALTKGVSVAWSKVPFSVGGWSEWTRETRRDVYPVLLKGDGPFLFAGEHLSYVTGWQEGSVLSAHVAIEQLAQRVREKST
ncbi:MAG: FAD-dependent oxidoreductase, partial [Proteobacteria bacterium]|nr:FAD-dependent oxidoreductase [Pseudomonadota bacterium]